jgi:hypothetical protein
VPRTAFKFACRASATCAVVIEWLRERDESEMSDLSTPLMLTEPQTRADGLLGHATPVDFMVCCKQVPQAEVPGTRESDSRVGLVAGASESSGPCVVRRVAPVGVVRAVCGRPCEAAPRGSLVLCTLARLHDSWRRWWGPSKTASARASRCCPAALRRPVSRPRSGPSEAAASSFCVS